MLYTGQDGRTSRHALYFFQVKLIFKEIKKSYVHRSMSFDKCVHLCDSAPQEDRVHDDLPDVVPCPSQSTPFRGKHCSEGFLPGVVLPVLELSILEAHTVASFTPQNVFAIHHVSFHCRVIFHCMSLAVWGSVLLLVSFWVASVFGYGE